MIILVSRSKIFKNSSRTQCNVLCNFTYPFRASWDTRPQTTCYITGGVKYKRVFFVATRHFLLIGIGDLSERKGRGKGEESCKNKFAKILSEYCQILPGATPTPPRAWFEWVGGKKKSNLLSSFFFRNTMKKTWESASRNLSPCLCSGRKTTVNNFLLAVRSFARN